MAHSLEGTKILQISALQTFNFNDFGVQPVNIKRFCGAACQYQAILLKVLKTMLKS